MSKATPAHRRRANRSGTRASVRSGAATVRLRDGRVFVGFVCCDGRAVDIDGRLRLVSLVGGQPIARYCSRNSRRTMPLGAVREIVWHERQAVGV
jgi:hypothetical protein